MESLLRPTIEEHLLERISALETELERAHDRLELMLDLLHRQATSGLYDHAMLDALVEHGADADRRIWALAGIARPQAFFDMLASRGLRFEPLPLADHAAFDAPPWPDHATDVVLTEKDAVKLRPELLAPALAATRVWVAPLDYAPDPALWAALDAAIGEPPGRTLETPWTPA